MQHMRIMNGIVLCIASGFSYDHDAGRKGVI